MYNLTISLIRTKRNGNGDVEMNLFIPPIAAALFTFGFLDDPAVAGPVACRPMVMQLVKISTVVAPTKARI